MSDIVFGDALSVFSTFLIKTMTDSTYPPPQDWIFDTGVQWTAEIIKQLLARITTCTLGVNTATNSRLNEGHRETFWLDGRAYRRVNVCSPCAAQQIWYLQ
jgi:hypothetical protein